MAPLTCHVIGNWKMNGSRDFAKRFFDELKPGLEDLSSAVNVAICPPYTLLSEVGRSIAGTRAGLGAQDASDVSAGALTGDISVAMLKEWDVRQVIVGHSERRLGHGESSELVARKAAAVSSAGMQPVVCVGETADQRSSGQANFVVAEQLAALQDLLSGDELAGCLIAYEPVWAIGTGETASPEQAQEMHAFIRQSLGAVGAGISIIYGGSVKAGNALELFSQPDIQGGLIGGASLDAEEFIAICRAADRSQIG